MKKLFLALASLTAFATANAEEGWETNLETALKKAAEEKKSVMVEFTGSDWCPPCKQMHKEIFSQEEFTKEAGAKYVLVKLDFPQSKELPADEVAHNEEMAKKYSIEGFPTVVLLKNDGTEITREVGYSAGGLKKFLEWLNEKAG